MTDVAIPSRFSRLRQPILAVISFLVVFASVGYWMLSMYDRSEKIDVVVAARDLEAPRALTADDLTIVERTRGDLPRTAIAKKDAVLGIALMKAMSEKEILTTNHLLREVAATSESLLVTSGNRGFSLSSSWLTAPPPKIAVNDRIQILASAADKSVETGTTIIGSNLRVLKVENDRDGLPSRMLLDASLTEAAQVLQAHTNRLALLVLVQPPSTPAAEETPPSTP